MMAEEYTPMLTIRQDFAGAFVTLHQDGKTDINQRIPDNMLPFFNALCSVIAAECGKPAGIPELRDLLATLNTALELSNLPMGSAIVEPDGCRQRNHDPEESSVVMRDEISRLKANAIAGADNRDRSRIIALLEQERDHYATRVHPISLLHVLSLVHILERLIAEIRALPEESPDANAEA